MTARRHEGDVLVMGYSLEAALTATLAASAGCKVLWLGGAPEPTVSLGKHRLPAAPSLLPSLAHAPALARVLREVSLLTDVQRALLPVSVQFLSERRRISSAEDWMKVPQGPAGLESLQTQAAIATEVSELSPGLGYFARRSFSKRRDGIHARLAAPDGTVGEATGLLNGLFSRQGQTPAATLQTLAAPSDLPGGTLALGHMLQRKCVDLGARLFPEGLSQPLTDLRVGWKGIEGRLFSGEAISAKVALVAVDEATASQALPPASPLLRQFKVPSGQPLMRRSLVLRRRGLPEPLGTMALLLDGQAIWIEHRTLSAEFAAVSLFWRPWLADRSEEAIAVQSAFERVAPFHQRHVVEQMGPVAIADHDRDSVFAKPRLTRRMLTARGPLFGLNGVEGAALAATALAERCLKLAPRPKAAA